MGTKLVAKLRGVLRTAFAKRRASWNTEVVTTRGHRRLAQIGLIVGFCIVIFQVQAINSRQRAADNRVADLTAYNITLRVYDDQVLAYNKCLASVDTRGTVRAVFHQLTTAIRAVAPTNAEVKALTDSIDAFVDANYPPLTVAGGSAPGDLGCGKLPERPAPPPSLTGRVIVLPAVPGSTPPTAVLVKPS